MINEELVKVLLEKHLTISFVESFTGGLAAKSITDVSGSSKTFLGSLVSYSTLIKEFVLGIDKKIIDEFGVASKECALEMAKKGKEMFNSDIVISFTGEAGPISNTNIEVGTCFIGIYVLNEIKVEEIHIDGSRNDVRTGAIEYAFKKILKKF